MAENLKPLSLYVNMHSLLVKKKPAQNAHMVLGWRQW
jgi:hypothetical protein